MLLVNYHVSHLISVIIIMSIQTFVLYAERQVYHGRRRNVFQQLRHIVNHQLSTNAVISFFHLPMCNFGIKLLPVHIPRFTQESCHNE